MRTPIEILESMIKKAKIKNWNGSWYMIQALTEAKLTIEREVGSESLEDIIEDIGKGMCHFWGIYPNAWYWNIKDIWDWTHKGDTLIEVFKAFREELRKNWNM